MVDKVLAAQIGRRLRIERMKKGYTISELAEVLGINQGAVSTRENGAHILSIPILLTYMDVFGLTLSEFFAGIEEEDTTKIEEELALKENFKKLREGR